MNKTRIAIFGSYYRGYFLIRELMNSSIQEHIEIAGIATDDPTQKFVSPQRRVWQYGYTSDEMKMVQQEACALDITAYMGKIKSEPFYRMYETKWRPDLCVMATFGQLIDKRLFNYPQLGFYNFHPCYDEQWPSYVGPNPFSELTKDRKPYAVIAMHHVDEHFDHGALVSFSERIHIPPNMTVTDLHKISSPIAAKFAVREISKLILSTQQKHVA